MPIKIKPGTGKNILATLALAPRVGMQLDDAPTSSEGPIELWDGDILVDDQPVQRLSTLGLCRIHNGFPRSTYARMWLADQLHTPRKLVPAVLDVLPDHMLGVDLLVERTLAGSFLELVGEIRYGNIRCSWAAEVGHTTLGVSRLIEAHTWGGLIEALKAACADAAQAQRVAEMAAQVEALAVAAGQLRAQYEHTIKAIELNYDMMKPGIAEYLRTRIEQSQESLAAVRQLVPVTQPESEATHAER